MPSPDCNFKFSCRRLKTMFAVMFIALALSLNLRSAIAEESATATASTTDVSTAATTAPLVMHFYFTPTCPLCEPAKQKVNDAEKQFGDRIKIFRHDHSASRDIFNSLIFALDVYGREDTPTQALFFGKRVLDGDAINSRLIPEIESALAAGEITPDFATLGITSAEANINLAGDGSKNSVNSESTASSTASMLGRRATLPIVLATGLFDGFNPCAFATVILFVSMLSAAGRDRKIIFATGISFIIAVFVTYLALGIAFYQIMEILGGSPVFKFVALAIKWLALAMVAVAAVLSLIDFYRAWRSGGTGKMLLVLPENLKNRIRKRLRVTAYGRSLIAGALISGVVISLLEAACTGQTYLPVITGIISEQAASARGYFLLLLYNVMFILPLAAVFAMVFIGVTSDQIAKTARKHVHLTKLALALVFIAMTLWLGDMLLPTIFPNYHGLF